MITAMLIINVYFMPSLIAVMRRKQFVGILILNLFLGWTILGWVVALIWAAVTHKENFALLPPAAKAAWLKRYEAQHGHPYVA